MSVAAWVASMPPRSVEVPSGPYREAGFLRPWRRVPAPARATPNAESRDVRARPGSGVQAAGTNGSEQGAPLGNGHGQDRAGGAQPAVPDADPARDAAGDLDTTATSLGSGVATTARTQAVGVGPNYLLKSRA